MYCRTKGRSTDADCWLQRYDELVAACRGSAVPAAEVKLRSLVQDALDRSRDDLVDAACASSRDAEQELAARQLIERCAEETQVMWRGVRCVFQLFAIPLILQFEAEIPESRLDWELARLEPPSGQHHVRRNAGSSVILPGFYGYGDLRSIPLPMLRSGGGAVALAASMAAKAGDGPLRLRPAPRRRGTTYLRIVVGQRLLLDDETPVETPWPTLDDTVEIALGRALGVAVRSRSEFDGHYHSSLYRGLWAYQESRLREIALDACSRADNVNAAVDAGPGVGDQPIRLALFAGSSPEIGAYLLQPHPWEPLLNSIERVARALRRSGVEEVHCTAVPVDRRDRGDLRDSFLALPI